MSAQEAQLFARIYNPLIGLDPGMRRMQDIYGLPGGKTADGLVHHAKDRAHGVVSEAFRSGDWALWSDLPAIEYSYVSPHVIYLRGTI